MLTLVVALLCGAAVTAVFRVSHLVHSWPAAITPGVLAAIGAAVFVFRRVMRQVNPLVEEAQRHLQASRRELGLKTLRSARRWSRWHPLLEGQLASNIGALLYVEGDLDGAIAELSKASKRSWESQAFLACAQFKKHQEEPMVRAFDAALKANEKEGLLYTMYAFCLLARGKRDEAVAVLRRGLEKLPGDQRLENNLELAQAGKKLKVAPYAERWLMFNLDGGQPTAPKGIPRGFAQRPGFRPGFRQRPMRRGR